MDTRTPLLSQDYPSTYPNSSAPPPPYTPAYQFQQHNTPPPPAGGYPAPYPAAQPQYGGGGGYYPYQPAPPAQVPMPPDPRLATVNAVVKAPVVKDYYLLSVIISIGVVISCLPCMLLCTLPALLLSMSSRQLAQEGKIEAAKKKTQYALICNIVAIVSFVLSLVVAVITFILSRVILQLNNPTD